MVRVAVKLLLLDQDDQLLLIRAKDPQTQASCWYPVGGGIDPGETLQEAAAREAHEETGLTSLPPGSVVWRRNHTYEFDGRTVDVHETWLLHRIAHFTPAPADLSDYETRTILGFNWWQAQDLTTTPDTIFPPRLGSLLTTLLSNGVPPEPIDISES